MCSLKMELPGICNGCLSSERDLVPLRQYEILYSMLLNEPVQESKYFDLAVCWECIGFLKSVLKFQKRIQKANIILQQSLFQLDTKSESLSSLTIRKSDTYDVILNHDDVTNTEYKVIDPNELLDIKQEYNDDKDEYNNLNDEYNNDNDGFVCKNEEYLNNIQEYIVNKNEYENTQDDTKLHKYKNDKNTHTIKNLKHSNSKYFKRKAKVTRNVIDIKKWKEYTNKVVLSVSEMERSLERERNTIGTTTTKSKLLHKCRMCNIKFIRKVDLMRHDTFAHETLKHRGPYKCQKCSTEIQNREELEKHWTSHNSAYQCTLCGTYSTTKMDVDTHLWNCHATRYTCIECSAVYYNIHEFNAHYKELHETVICDYCGKTKKSKKSLENHMRVNHISPTCKLCSRIFKNYHRYKVHYRLHHLPPKGNELAYCVECDKQFPTENKYRQHLKNAPVHMTTTYKKVPCPDCGKIFSRNIYMRNHYRLFHSKDSKHHCEICDKYFSNGYGVRKHKQMVHEKQRLPKDKICDICGRGFSTNRILMNHRYTHTGERPHKCVHCGAAFAQKTALQTHTRSIHKHIIGIL